MYCNSIMAPEWLYTTRKKAFNTQGLSRRQAMDSHRSNSYFCLFNQTHKGISEGRVHKKFLQTLFVPSNTRRNLTCHWEPLTMARSTNSQDTNSLLLKLASLLWAWMWHQAQTMRGEEKMEAKLLSTQRKATIIFLYKDPFKSVNQTLFISHSLKYEPDIAH